MKTTNEKRYDHFIQTGLATYQKAVEAKSPKNTLKHALSSQESFQKAKDMADLVNMEEKIPYVNEYLVLNEAIIANAYLEDKKVAEAVDHYNLAIDLNLHTLKNQETLIRENFITSELIKIALLQKNTIQAESFAWKLYKNSCKLTDANKRIKYHRLSRDLFLETKNVDGIEKNFKQLLKIVSKGKDQDFMKTKAEIFEEYGTYLMRVEAKSAQIVKYLKKAKDLYEKLTFSANVQKIEQLLKKISWFKEFFLFFANCQDWP